MLNSGDAPIPTESAADDTEPIDTAQYLAMQNEERYS